MARTSTNSSDASIDFGIRNVLQGATSALWSIWINVASWASSSQTFWYKDDFPTQNAGWGLQRNGSNDYCVFYMRGGGTAIQCFFPTTPTISGAGWMHLAISINGAGTVGTYTNGATVGGGSVGGSNPYGNTTNQFGFGIANSSIALADAAVWLNTSDVKLIAALAAGASPLQVGPRPAFYAPFSGRGRVEPDLAGSFAPKTVPTNSGYAAGPAALKPFGPTAQVEAVVPTLLQPRLRRGLIFLAGAGSTTYAKSASAGVVLAATLSENVAVPVAATRTVVAAAAASSTVSHAVAATSSVVVSAVASTASAHATSGTRVVSFAATATTGVMMGGLRSARVRFAFGAIARSGVHTYSLTASASFVLRAGARYESPLNDRGINYLGRFQLGQDVPLRLQAVLEQGDEEITPTTAPLVRVYRDGSLQRSFALPSDFTDGGLAGRFRGRYTLGATDAVGRYVVVYLYGLASKTRGAVDVFEVVPGGDPGGPIISTFSLGRPDGDVVLAHLGSGKLAAAQGPYIDEGV